MRLKIIRFIFDLFFQSWPSLIFFLFDSFVSPFEDLKKKPSWKWSKRQEDNGDTKNLIWWRSQDLINFFFFGLPTKIDCLEEVFVFMDGEVSKILRTKFREKTSRFAKGLGSLLAFEIWRFSWCELGTNELLIKGVFLFKTKLSKNVLWRKSGDYNWMIWFFPKWILS